MSPPPPGKQKTDSADDRGARGDYPDTHSINDPVGRFYEYGAEHYRTVAKHSVRWLIWVLFGAILVAINIIGWGYLLGRWLRG